MSFQPVEWVLAIYYGPSSHRATYRRLSGTKYTKDYIQLSRRPEFVEEVARLFPPGTGTVPLTYEWPTGSTSGAFVFVSADRPHLKWETSLGAPKAWKMSLAPSDTTAETIPGDPSHLNEADAERELELVAGRGAGQPYLLAIKLRNEPNKLHLRVYLKNPEISFDWAATTLLPTEIQELVAATSRTRASAHLMFDSGGMPLESEFASVLSRLSIDNAIELTGSLAPNTVRSLAAYLRSPGHGVFFDPTRNHDAWQMPAPLPEHLAASVVAIVEILGARFLAVPGEDAAAETLETDPTEVASFREQIVHRNFEVPDTMATVKTRGSAQKAFADAVKANYDYRCAITGIATSSFLVASHIVPWSQDQSIRLDPSNGICLSLLVDRAFEKGYLLIQDDLTVVINWEKVGDDQALREVLESYDARRMTAPIRESPRAEYLRRRREMAVQAE